MARDPDERIELRFLPRQDTSKKHTAGSLSAVALDGDSLWVAADEFSSIERLDADGRAYQQQIQSVDLRPYLEIPNSTKLELDIEGLALDGDDLWVVGSHAVVRKKLEAKSGETEDEARARFLKMPDDPSLRYVLGRVRLEQASDGRRPGDHQAAAWLPFVHGANALTQHLEAKEAYKGLLPFLKIPAKENGFDIEGIAATRNRVLLGLRGPVLRGWAILLDLSLDGTKPLGIGELRLHLLEMDGLGIRDLAIDGEDLLPLAGPTMDLDGPVQVRRWENALAAAADRVVKRKKLPVILDVPFGHRTDHAEGIALLQRNGKEGLLVLYDSPALARYSEEEDPSRYVADWFAL
jgi:hypothetical protein